MKKYICLMLLFCLMAGLKGQLLGGTQETSGVTFDQATTMIRGLAAFSTRDRQGFLADLFKDATLLKTLTQVVAGTNYTFLFKTKRGLECFKVYNSFDGSTSLIRYAHGDQEASVLRDCRSFSNMKEPHEVAESVLASHT